MKCHFRWNQTELARQDVETDAKLASSGVDVVYARALVSLDGRYFAEFIVFVFGAVCAKCVYGTASDSGAPNSPAPF